MANVAPQMQMPMQAAPQMMQAAPQMQQPMQMQAEQVHIGNAGSLRMKVAPYDYEGKYPHFYSPCCGNQKKQAWRPMGVNTLVHGAGPTGENTLLVKEENILMQTEGCCVPGDEYANSNVKIFAGADEFRNKEIYRIQTEGPEASFCNSKMEFVSQVLGTDPSKKMKMVGESVMVYSPSPCGAFCGHNPIGDVNIVNKETGAQFNIAAIPVPNGCCGDKMDFALPVTMANGQEVGRIVKDEGQKMGCGPCYCHNDLGFQQTRFEKRMQLTDDDQALIIAGVHLNGVMRVWFHSAVSLLCFGKRPQFSIGTRYNLLPAMGI